MDPAAREMDAATDAAGLALRIGSAMSDLTSFMVDIGQDFPLIYVVLKTLKNIRDKMDTIKSNQAALEALHQRCACITACVIVKCRCDKSVSSRCSPRGRRAGMSVLLRENIQ